ncbi:DeoR/GlpR transcriptional regulator [Alginatibacterium sediminis]|uniref:DeoR/GlpR transcriptional regulator n=1 Tax=Alginatibacterium sediminis TaxID=2164068 RepID=A0A420EJJ8_9ALTE|nr:DeoR/GlpR family DNA-binding transcription regulator [Alginatibacterium sediminis]RKF20892.1 DeoR/GlpR transcriptional regulator [Alginatibacterium sediminis]
MTNPRQKQLLKLINDKGYCSVEELAESLDVSTQTIRRDIKKLNEEKLLVRHHGGASSPDTTTNLDYEVRKVTDTEQKNAIASKIASMIPDNSTIFLTIGTTIEVIASQLLEKKNLQIITNSLRVANILHRNPNFDVLIPGGKVKASNGGIVGTQALEFIDKFRFDYLITSTASIDVDGTLLEYDLNESLITQTVMKSARHVMIAMDSSKFVPKGSIEMGHIGETDYLFTDTSLPEELAEAMMKTDTKLVICEGE